MKVIIVTGTPGTGKTTLSKKISKKLNFQYLDVNDVIQSNPNLITGFDKKRDSKIIDEKKLANTLAKLIKSNKRNLIIDSHLSHYINKKLVSLCIVTRCSDLKKLKERLKKRKYKKEKIKENMEAEIFDVCLIEAMQYQENILVVDTCKRLSYKEINERL